MKSMCRCSEKEEEERNKPSSNGSKAVKTLLRCVTVTNGCLQKTRKHTKTTPPWENDKNDERQNALQVTFRNVYGDLIIAIGKSDLLLRMARNAARESRVATELTHKKTVDRSSV